METIIVPSVKWEWKESSGQKYLFAKGDTLFDLGAAIGHGMAEEIGFTKRMQKLSLDRVRALPGARDRLEYLIDGYIKCIPEKYAEEISGIVRGYNEETNDNASYREITMQSCLLDIAGRFRTDAVLYKEGCTDLAAVDPDGTVVHGQNYDSDPVTTPSNAWVLGVTKSEPAFFQLRVGAGIGWPVGKNECGVAMTVSFINTVFDPDPMIPRSCLVRRAFEKSTAAEASKAMTDENGRSPFTYGFVVSDSRTCIGTQVTPSERRDRVCTDILVQTNRYTYPDWEQYLRNPRYSAARQEYAEASMRSAYMNGGVTEDALLGILRDKPRICRDKTVLFMTRNYFGMGNPMDCPIGKMPL